MDQPSPPVAAHTPAGAGERIELVDALRGFALAGVLMVNLGAMSLYFFLDDGARAALPTAGFDAIGRTVKAILFDRKAVTLFSMLFGLGFAIQLERAAVRGVEGLSFFVRRLAVLGLFGLVHVYLIWWGDILLMYAALGLLLIPFRKASNPTLLWLGLAIALLLPPLLAPLIDPALAWVPGKEAMYATTLSALSSSSYLEVVRAHFRFGNWTYLAWWDDWFFIFGRFLLGYWAGRTLLLHDMAASSARLKRIMLVALPAGIVGTALELGLKTIEAGIPALTDGIGGMALATLVRGGSLGLGITYAAGFALLFRRPQWRARLGVLAPMGRMALTNYLMHSLIGVTLFYGFALGIGPRYGYPGWLLVWATLVSGQILLSRWWLSRHRFGPMEWLWRSLTYGRTQPMRLSPSAATALG